MKKHLFRAMLMLMLMLCFSLCLSVSAKSYEGYGLTLPFGDDYTVLTASNLSKNPETLKALQYDAASLGKYMKEQKIEAIAVGENLSERFVFKYETSDFTKQTDSFNQFDETSLHELKISLIGEEAETVTENGIVWMRAKASVDSEQKAYHYLTVQNGALYSVTYFGTSAEPIETLMANAALELHTESDFSGTVMLIVLIVVSIVCLIALGILGVSLWQDFKNRGEGQSEEENPVSLHIKRRHIKK